MSELTPPTAPVLTGFAKVAAAAIPVVALATITAVGVAHQAPQSTEVVPVVTTAPGLAGSPASPASSATPAKPTPTTAPPQATTPSARPTQAPVTMPKPSLRAIPQKTATSPSRSSARPAVRRTTVQPSTQRPSSQPSTRRSTTARPTSAKPTAAPTTRRTTTRPTSQPTSAPQPSTSAPKTTAPSTNGYGAVEQAIFTCINGHRTRAGLKPLALDSAINRVAENWSAQQAREGRMYHNPDFSSQITGWSRVAENVGVYSGSGVAAVLCQAWMDSPGHRANIMNPVYTSTGIGVVKDSKGASYATQNFKG